MLSETLREVATRISLGWSFFFDEAHLLFTDIPSVLEQKIVRLIRLERARVCSSRSQIGPITPEQRQQIIQSSLVAGVYEQAVDRESAYEILKRGAAQLTAPGHPLGGSRR